jgi:hypothetical protein
MNKSPQGDFLFSGYAMAFLIGRQNAHWQHKYMTKQAKCTNPKKSLNSDQILSYFEE